MELYIMALQKGLAVSSHLFNPTLTSPSVRYFHAANICICYINVLVNGHVQENIVYAVKETSPRVQQVNYTEKC